MILTLSNQTVINCLDISTVNELVFEYNRETFLSTMDNFTHININGSLLEKYNDDNEILSTDYIIKKKISTVEIIDNTIVKVTLVNLNAMESDILEAQTYINEIMITLGEMLETLTAETL